MLGKEMSVALIIWLLTGNFPAAELQISKFPDRLSADRIQTDRSVSAELVLKKLGKKQDIVLVDVRNSAEFEKCRIPGSLSIPLFAVRTKAFLKPKTLILVNEGYHHTQLRQACEELNASGFIALFMHGGLNAWKESGGLIEGDPFAMKELNRISPADLLAEKEDGHRIIIDVSSSENKNTRSLFPEAVHIPYRKDENRFIPAFRRESAKQKNRSPASVLIVNEKGEFYEDIEKTIRKAEIGNVFFLKGGIEAYQKFSEERKLIRQAENSSVKTQKCSRCQ